MIWLALYLYFAGAALFAGAMNEDLRPIHRNPIAIALLVFWPLAVPVVWIWEQLS